jgi:hypothetical protein
MKYNTSQSRLLIARSFTQSYRHFSDPRLFLSRLRRHPLTLNHYYHLLRLAQLTVDNFID